MLQTSVLHKPTASIARFWWQVQPIPSHRGQVEHGSSMILWQVHSHVAAGILQGTSKVQDPTSQQNSMEYIKYQKYLSSVVMVVDGYDSLRLRWFGCSASWLKLCSEFWYVLAISIIGIPNGSQESGKRRAKTITRLGVRYCSWDGLCLIDVVRSTSFTIHEFMNQQGKKKRISVI